MCHSTPRRETAQFPNFKICPVCGKSFRVKPSHYPKSTYCSRACMAEGYKARMQGENNPNYRDAAQRVCLECGKEFSSYNKTRKYCSHACYGKHMSRDPERVAVLRVNFARARKVSAQRRKTRKQGRKSTCVVCGKVWPTGDSNRKYCDDCQAFSRLGPLAGMYAGKRCVVCETYFESPNPNKVTCSKKCSREWLALRQSGEKSHRWQGGKTSDTVRQRNSLKYQLWRESVFRRDNYTCALCGRRGGKLAAHHIKTFRDHPSLRTDEANGIALCWPCHASIKGKEATYEALFMFMAKADAPVYVLESVEHVPALLERVAGDWGV